MTVLTLMRLTLLELWRQRIALAPIVVLVLILALGLLPTPEVVVNGEPWEAEARQVVVAGGRMLGFFGAFLGLVVGSGLVANEIDRGTVLLLATKPQPRWLLVAAKALGAAVFLLVSFAAWALALALVLGTHYGWAIAPSAFAVTVLGVLPALLFMAVALCYSTRLPAMGASAAGLFTWLAASVAGGLVMLKQVPAYQVIGRAAEALGWVLPSGRLEALPQAVVFGPAPSHGDWLSALAIALWLALAVVGFQRRNLS